jgi:endonuclease YncB( thermonuclease family)
MGVRRASLPLKIIYAMVAAMLLWAIIGAVLAADLVGQATVIDGDTLEMHGQRIRLWGIDAPEADQLCRGDDSLRYRCGARAANSLDAFIARRTVRCLPRGADQYGRIVAACDVAGTDIAGWLVGQGLALDWPRYSNGRYATPQRQAERAGIGMWAGSYVDPWRYRACMRTLADPIRCSDETNK